MPVCITINGENAGQTLAELGDLSKGLLGSTSFTPATGAQQGVIAADTAEPQKVGRSRGRAAKGEPEAEKPVVANISTGGERNDPNEGKVQTAPAEEPKKLTVDDVRNAANPYIKKWTVEAASVDLGLCLKDATGKEKISELAADPAAGRPEADQATLQKAVDAFKAAGEAPARYVPKAA